VGYIGAAHLLSVVKRDLGPWNISTFDLTTHSKQITHGGSI
jgi:hypothetical protein